MYDESIKLPAASNDTLAPTLNYINTKLQAKLEGSCLKQDKVTYTQKKMVNIYVAYEMNLWPFNFCKDFGWGNSLFGAIKLIKYANLDKYTHSGYGIAFDTRGIFSLSNDSGFVKNLIIFDIDMGPSVHINNERKYILVFILLSNRKNFVSVCIIMGWIVMYLLMVLKYINSKQRILK